MSVSGERKYRDGYIRSGNSFTVFRRNGSVTITVILVVLAALYKDSLFLMGSMLFGGPMDTALVLMQLKWPADFFLGRAPEYIRDVFSFPMYYPYLNAFSLSDTLFGNQIVWFPLYRLSENPILATNVWILICGCLNVLAMRAYLMNTGILEHWDRASRRAGALFFGLLFAFSTFRLDQHVHLQLFPQYWTPVAFLALDRMIQTKRVRYVILLAVSMAMQWLCGVHLGIMCFTGVALLGFGYLVSGNDRLGTIIRFTVSFSMALVLLTPVIIPAIRSLGVVETYDRTVVAGARPGWGGFLLPFAGNKACSLIGMRTVNATRPVLFPGLAMVFIIITSLVIYIRNGKRHQWVIYSFGISFLMLFLAAAPVDWIMHIPVFQVLRAPNRLSLLAVPFMIMACARILGYSRCRKTIIYIISVASFLFILETTLRDIPAGTYLNTRNHAFEHLVKDLDRRPVLILPQAVDKPNDRTRARISQNHMELLSHSWTPGLAGRSGPRPRFVTDITRQSLRVPVSVRHAERFIKRIRRLGYGAVVLMDSSRSGGYRRVLSEVIGPPRRYSNTIEVFRLYESKKSIPLPPQLHLGKHIRKSISEKSFRVRRGRRTGVHMPVILKPLGEMLGIIQTRFSITVPVTIELVDGSTRSQSHRIEITSLTDVPDLEFAISTGNLDIESIEVAGVRVGNR